MLPPFLRGDLPGVHPVVSVWLRNLEEIEELAEKWAASLPEEAFWWVPGDHLNPIGGILRHIAGASTRLAILGLGQSVPPEMRIRPADEMAVQPLPMDQALAQFRAEMAQVRGQLATLTADDLERMVKVGQAEPVPARYLLDHIAAHGQQHIGQVIVLHKLWNLRQAGS